MSIPWRNQCRRPSHGSTDGRCSGRTCGRDRRGCHRRGCEVSIWTKRVDGRANEAQEGRRKKNVRQCYARRRAGNDTLDICVVFITVIAQSSAMRAMPTDTVPVSKVPPLPTQPPARSDVAKHTRCGSPCRSYAVDGQYTALAVSKIRTGCENQTFA